MPKASMKIARALCLLALPVVALSAPSAASPAVEPPTPVLLERAVEQGELTRAAADRYLIAAMKGDQIPAAYRSDTPFRGTIPLLELHSRGALHPVATAGTDTCDLSNAPLTNTIESAHFYIEYSAATLGGGLTIDDYIAALEGSWVKEVDEFGWAAPPVYPPSPAPANKYPVRIDPTLGPTLYGFVASSGSHAGFVGNNKNTNWNEGDAFATCMVLNSDYDPFPGEPLTALQATAAHEFNHSIQFGWGVLAGQFPDYVFVEGGATWMEDEVFDDSNDNYNYLWPAFDDDMGEYKDNLPIEPYEYWITWRGLTEPYGTGSAGGGEDVMERFWESMSKNQLDSLEALDSSLHDEGTSLAAAFDAYAVAVKFNKPCGGGYASPHCLEEGPAYVAAKGPTTTHGSVAMSQTFQGSMLDNYSIRWLDLPVGIDLQAVLRNTSNGGRFRATLACDTGSGLVLAPFTSTVGAGEVAYARSWKGSECASPIAVISNVSQTAANPSSSTPRSFTLQVTPPADPTTLTVKGRANGGDVIASGKLKPPGGKVIVTLFKKKHGGWKKVDSKKTKAKGGGKYKTKLSRPDAKKCHLKAEFPGTVPLLPSSATNTFSC